MTPSAARDEERIDELLGVFALKVLQTGSLELWSGPEKYAEQRAVQDKAKAALLALLVSARIDELDKLIDLANLRQATNSPGYPVGILDLHQRKNELSAERSGKKQ